MPAPRTRTRIARKAAAALGVLATVMLFAPAPACAFMIDVPPEVRDKPQEEQKRWVRSYMQENYTLQLQVARERHDQRMGAADQFVRTMAEQSFERRKIIEQMRQESSRDMKAMAASVDAGLYGAVALGALVVVLWWFFYGRPVVVQRRAREVEARRGGRDPAHGPRVYVLRTRKQASTAVPGPATPTRPAPKGPARPAR